MQFVGQIFSQTLQEIQWSFAKNEVGPFERSRNRKDPPFVLNLGNSPLASLKTSSFFAIL